jgi:hypothetical protein
MDDKMSAMDDKMRRLTDGFSQVIASVNVLTAKSSGTPSPDRLPAKILAIEQRNTQSHKDNLATPFQHRTLTFSVPPQKGNTLQFEQPSTVTTTNYPITSSGLRLAFAIVPTLTVLGSDLQGKLALVQQHFVGSGYAELSRKDSKAPQLGRVITQCNLLMDDDPYDPNISLLVDVQSKAEEKILLQLKQGLARTARENPQFHNPNIHLDELQNYIFCMAALPIEWPSSWNILYDTPDYVCIVRVHVGFDENFNQPISRLEVRLMLSLLTEHLFTFLRKLNMGQNVLQTNNARQVYMDLETNYDPSPSEEPVINILRRLGTLAPNLYSGYYRPDNISTNRTNVAIYQPGEVKNMKRIK